jgi:pantothenate kinase
MQIGGSLAKVVYFSRESMPTSKGGRLRFIKFETERIDECIDFVANLVAARRLSSQYNSEKIVLKTTGGGSHKYHDKFVQKFGEVAIEKEDEMDSLIAGKRACSSLRMKFRVYALFEANLVSIIGLNFLVAEIPYETFTYTESDRMRFEEKSHTRFPYMVFIYM